jgi:hypothetical protein
MVCFRVLAVVMGWVCKLVCVNAYHIGGCNPVTHCSGLKHPVQACRTHCVSFSQPLKAPLDGVALEAVVISEDPALVWTS